MTLLDLATQGDPGTIDAESEVAELKLLTPLDLYGLWERQQWSAQTFDFGGDRQDWLGLDESTRTRLLVRLSTFYLGEERVATAFAPFVGAAESVAEEAFLATQLVDEVRHTVFFDRFFREVIGFEAEDAIEDRLRRARERVNADFVTVFDGRLIEIAGRLRASPSDKEALVEGVTLYHMAIEGALALTGQHFLIARFENLDQLPCFLAGIKNVARDEHRHLAFGTWYLQRKFREDRRFGEIIHRTLQDVLPPLQGVFGRTGTQSSEDDEPPGYRAEDLSRFAANALSRRLKVIGVGLPG